MHMQGIRLYYLVPMCIDGSIANCATKPGSSAGRSHFPILVDVLPRESKVQHVHFPSGVAVDSHRKVGLCNISNAHCSSLARI